MSNERKVVITCAVTGAAHTPTMSPYLPITPEQIADHAIEAANAGAAIVHFHARNPIDGRPTPDPDVYAPAIEKIRRVSDAIINITTSGGPNTTVEERIAAAIRFRPELASLNMGSLSPYGRQGIAAKFDHWKHAWERELFLAAPARIYPNTEEIITRTINEVGAVGTRFECECYDVGHLYNVAYFADIGLLKPPFIIQTVFGFSGGIGLDADNMTHMRNVADRLFGTDYHWSVLAPGKHQFRLCTMGATMGSNVRVGMEDNLYLDKGRLAHSNAEQVARIRDILTLLSLDIATPAEARQMLRLKRGEQASV
ncbi:3-keto-5-aminohexanoate cleavage protein [Sinorhizobium terangae]|uniref:3-keto-5-aminohexanoate cleavage protein n=1 Tax=Sinorhizobium terangae TaxID=110322 RepID=UPI0024B0A467|nr:3-keto-5-aminohexanoate cleavage protein [Sinorhizobium terangae]WFU51681.1 3-keto-5-aminohexanoate cleavage protein [Sinorhizobium terangae]